MKEKNPDIEFKWYAPDVGFIRGKEQNDVTEMIDLIDSANASDQQDVLDDPNICKESSTSTSATLAVSKVNSLKSMVQGK